MSLFENTLKQIEQAAKIMNLDPNVKALMEHPQRIVEVNIPVKMDDGSLKVYQGFRIWVFCFFVCCNANTICCVYIFLFSSK